MYLLLVYLHSDPREWRVRDGGPELKSSDKTQGCLTELSILMGDWCSIPQHIVKNHRKSVLEISARGWGDERRTIHSPGPVTKSDPAGINPFIVKDCMSVLTERPWASCAESSEKAWNDGYGAQDWGESLKAVLYTPEGSLHKTGHYTAFQSEVGLIDVLLWVLTIMASPLTWWPTICSLRTEYQSLQEKQSSLLQWAIDNKIHLSSPSLILDFSHHWLECWLAYYLS